MGPEKKSPQNCISGRESALTSFQSQGSNGPGSRRLLRQFKMHYLIQVLAMFASLAMVESAIAGPPFFTDDPEPVDLHHWGFYVASINADIHGDWSGTAPHFEVNYGAAPELQLHMIAPLAYDSPPQGVTHYGFADLALVRNTGSFRRQTGGRKWAYFRCWKSRLPAMNLAAVI